MGYLCLQRTKLGHTTYYPGETIPDSAVLPKRARALKAYGYIKDIDPDGSVLCDGVETAKAPEGKFEVPIIQDDGGMMALYLDEGSIQHMFAILQMNVDAATNEIEKIDNEDELIAIHAVDSRNGVKKAAKKRASNLSSNEDETNAPSAYNETICEVSAEE